jgi:toxin FitB
VNLIDSSAWIEYFSEGPNATEFAVPIEDPQQQVVPTITLFEVFKTVARWKGEDAAFDAVATMVQGTVIELTVELALEAARISADTGLPMAESMIAATARAERAVLWTQDAHFQGLPDVEYRPVR